METTNTDLNNQRLVNINGEHSERHALLLLVVSRDELRICLIASYLVSLPAGKYVFHDSQSVV